MAAVRKGAIALVPQIRVEIGCFSIMRWLELAAPVHESLEKQGALPV